MVKARSRIAKMKPAITRPHIELIAGSVVTILTGAMCCYGSVEFRSRYEMMYGAGAEFALVTRVALAAKVWCPVFLGVALAVFARRVLRPPQTRTALAALIGLNLLCTVVVGYGFVAPFFETTFRMSR